MSKDVATGRRMKIRETLMGHLGVLGLLAVLRALPFLPLDDLRRDPGARLELVDPLEHDHLAGGEAALDRRLLALDRTDDDVLELDRAVRLHDVDERRLRAPLHGGRGDDRGVAPRLYEEPRVHELVRIE